MKKVGLSFVAIMGLIGMLEGGMLEKEGVVVYTPEGKSDIASMSFSKAIPMSQELGKGAFESNKLLEALSNVSKKSSSKSMVTMGETGSGSGALSTKVEITKVEADQGVGSTEYGEDIDGFNLPYTTSRVDMFKKINKTAFSKKYPYSGSGQLFFKIDGGNYICSASMIKRGVLVTAAHCVSEYGEGKFYSDFTYIPSRKGQTAPYGLWGAQKVYVVDKYFNGSEDECLYDGVVCKDDVAVILLEPKNGKYAGDYTGWYSYGINTYSFAGNILAQITQLGYPYSHDEATMMQRNDSVGIVVDDFKRNTVIASRMTGGSSGGPWIVNFGQKAKLGDGTRVGQEARSNLVVGVTSWGYTADEFKFQGASQFTRGNIVRLVKQACEDDPHACN